MSGLKAAIFPKPANVSLLAEVSPQFPDLSPWILPLWRTASPDLWSSEQPQRVPAHHVSLVDEIAFLGVLVVQYTALKGGWKEKKLSGYDKLPGMGDTRVNNCTVLII